MPNIYVLGLEGEQTRLLGREVTDWRERELRNPRVHVYICNHEGRVFRDGQSCSQWVPVNRVEGGACPQAPNL